MSEKLIRDGKVAVLYSPGYGAGWLTWNDEYPEMVFDKEIAELLEDGDFSPVKVEEICKAKYPDAYLGGAEQLKIEWLPQGTRFEISEYDGNESVRILAPSEGFIA